MTGLRLDREAARPHLPKQSHVGASCTTTCLHTASWVCVGSNLFTPVQFVEHAFTLLQVPTARHATPLIPAAAAQQQDGPGPLQAAAALQQHAHFLLLLLPLARGKLQPVTAMLLLLGRLLLLLLVLVVVAVVVARALQCRPVLPPSPLASCQGLTWTPTGTLVNQEPSLSGCCCR